MYTLGRIAALPVLELDLKIVSARITECRKKRTSHKEYEREALAIQEKIDKTKKYLKEGGSHARSGNINHFCATRLARKSKTVCVTLFHYCAP